MTWTFPIWPIWRKAYPPETVINLNTNSLTHLHHKVCELITLIKYIGVEFWGNWDELIFLVAWPQYPHQALKWLCLSFLKYLGCAPLKHKGHSMGKNIRDQLSLLTRSVFKLSLLLVLETIIWFDRQIGCY